MTKRKKKEGGKRKEGRKRKEEGKTKDVCVQGLKTGRALADRRKQGL